MILTSDLSWKNLIDQVTTKATSLLGLVRRFRHLLRDRSSFTVQGSAKIRDGPCDSLMATRVGYVIFLSTKVWARHFLSFKHNPIRLKASCAVEYSTD